MKRRFIACLRTGLLAVSIVLFCWQPTQAFDLKRHEDITNRALDRISRTLCDGRVATFSMSARTSIIRGNIWTDVWHQFESEFHFDDETLRSGNAKLVADEASIVNAADNGVNNGVNTRLALGTALHAVQDFYAHSTWADGHGSTPNFDLATSQFCGTGCVTGSPNDPAVCDNLTGSLPLPDAPLTTGYAWKNACQPPSRGKCIHGLLGCLGISKDHDTGRQVERSAADAAEDSTVRYINDILNQLGNDDAAICAVLGCTPQDCSTSCESEPGAVGWDQVYGCPGICFSGRNSLYAYANASFKPQVTDLSYCVTDSVSAHNSGSVFDPRYNFSGTTECTGDANSTSYTSLEGPLVFTVHSATHADSSYTPIMGYVSASSQAAGGSSVQRRFFFPTPMVATVEINAALSMTPNPTTIGNGAGVEVAFIAGNQFRFRTLKTVQNYVGPPWEATVAESTVVLLEPGVWEIRVGFWSNADSGGVFHLFGDSAGDVSIHFEEAPD